MPQRYNPQDRYFKKAKEQGYRARSVFKLEEIQQKFKLIKPGDHVLDLGSAPGSFLQYIAKIIGEKGLAIGLDLQTIKPLPYSQVKTFQVDLLDLPAVEKILRHQQFEVITADLAPNTSGIKDLDQGRSVELNEAALVLAQIYLKNRGNLILKIFVGEDFQPFWKKFKRSFLKSTIFTPQATRESSKEVYLVGMGKVVIPAKAGIS